MAYDITTPAAQMLMGDLNDMPSLEDVFFVKGKVAIVTGGSSGLGFNVTARLLQGGANVVMASFNPAEENNACGVSRPMSPMKTTSKPSSSSPMRPSVPSTSSSPAQRFGAMLRSTTCRKQSSRRPSAST